MRIVVTTDTLGGVWTYTRELVTELVRERAEVTLVSFGNLPTPAQMEWLDELRAVDFRPTAFKLEWMQDVAEDLWASAAYLLGVIEEVQPDLLHLNQFYYGSLNCDVPRIVVAHSDVVSWWVAVHGIEPRESEWIRSYREYVSRGLARADVVVAPTQTMLNSVIRHYGRPGRTCVIYNGRNPKLFNPHLAKETAVLSVGRLWDAGKNVALLTRFDPPAPTCIVGWERQPGDTPKFDIPPAAMKKIHMMGPQSESRLSQLFARTAIYAATSKYEPFGLAPLEAALSGCAVIANDIPAFREVWGDAARYFETNDAESLRNRIAELAADRELCASYGQMAYKRSLACFDSRRMVSDYLNLYQMLTPAAVVTE
jgi:glycogen synthase